MGAFGRVVGKPAQPTCIKLVLAPRQIKKILVTDIKGVGPGRIGRVYRQYLSAGVCWQSDIDLIRAASLLDVHAIIEL